MFAIFKQRTTTPFRLTHYNLYTPRAVKDRDKHAAYDHRVSHPILYFYIIDFFFTFFDFFFYIVSIFIIFYFYIFIFVIFEDRAFRRKLHIVMTWRRLLVFRFNSCAPRHPIVDTLSHHDYTTSICKWDFTYFQLAISKKYTDSPTYRKLVLTYEYHVLAGSYNLDSWICPISGLVDLWEKGQSGLVIFFALMELSKLFYFIFFFRNVVGPVIAL